MLVAQAKSEDRKYCRGEVHNSVTVADSREAGETREGVKRKERLEIVRRQLKIIKEKGLFHQITRLLCCLQRMFLELELFLRQQPCKMAENTQKKVGRLT